MKLNRGRSRPGAAARRAAAGALALGALGWVAGLSGCGSGGFELLPPELQPGPAHARPPQLGGLAVVEGSGLLDPTWSDDGFSSHPQLQLDAARFDRFGRLLIGGRGGNPPALTVRRLSAAGASDPLFGDAGQVRVEDAGPGGSAGPPGGAPRARALRLDASDRVVVASSTILPAAAPGAVSRSRALVLRLVDDGTLDPGFGHGGRVELAPAVEARSTLAVDVALDGAGRLLVLGVELEPQGPPSAGTIPRAFVQRLGPDGVPDGLHGEDGRAFVPAGEPSRPAALALDAAGRALVAGERLGAGARLALWRFTLDGAPDPAFGSGGEVLQSGAGELPPAELRAVGLVIEAGGGILVAGELQSDPGLAADWPNCLLDYGSGMATQRACAVWRFTADGALDAGFGQAGRARLAFNSGPYTTYGGGDHLDLGAGLALDPWGRIVIAQLSEPPNWEDGVGWATFSPPTAALLRLQPDGSLDPGLGGTGGVLLGTSPASPAWPNALGRPRALAIDAAGRVALAGHSESGSGIVWCLRP